MTNIAHVEDAFLYGKSQFDMFIKQFMADFYRPADQTFLNKLWREMPPDVHAVLKAQIPKEYEAVRELVEGG